MVDEGFHILEVEARGTNGKETPDWYNPNDYQRIVKLISPTTKSVFYIDLDAVSNLDLKNLSVEERVNLLSRYAVDPREVGSLPDRSVRSRAVPDKHVKSSTVNRLPEKSINTGTQSMTRQSVSVPTCTIEFRPSSNFKFYASCNEVIVKDSHIIVIVDKRSTQPSFDFEMGARIIISVPKKNIENVQCIASGPNFEYDHKQFFLFYMEPSLERFEAPPISEQELSESDKDFLEMLDREEIFSTEETALEKEDNPQI